MVAEKTVEILLVEDNPDDVYLTEEAFESCSVPYRIHVVNDGEEALSFLGQQKEYASAPRPDIVLLDLNLPKLSGRDVLKHMKGNENLEHIPVVVVSTSRAEEDITYCYKLHANCYIVKPTDLPQYIDMVKDIERFWFSIVALPEGEA